MKLKDINHFHPIMEMAPGPTVELALSGFGREARTSGAVEHTHAVDLDRYGGRHFHSGPVGPSGRPLGYSSRTLDPLMPPEVQPSDDAKVRVWDDRLRK